MNYALHMIAVTQARGIGPGRAYLDKQTGRGKDRVAALRLLRRRLSDVVFASLKADHRASRPQARVDQEPVHCPAAA
jgi:transposase